MCCAVLDREVRHGTFHIAYIAFRLRSLGRHARLCCSSRLFGCIGKALIRRLIVEAGLADSADLLAHGLDDVLFDAAADFGDLAAGRLERRTSGSCALLRLLLCLEKACRERPGRREQYRADRADAEDDDRAVDAKTLAQCEQETASKKAAARRQILRQDLLADGHLEVMPDGQYGDEEREQAEEAGRIVRRMVLRHVRPGDQEDHDGDEDGAHAEEVLQELREVDTDKAHIEPADATDRDESYGQERQPEELRAPARVCARHAAARALRLAHRLAPCPRAARSLFQKSPPCIDGMMTKARLSHEAAALL